MGRSTLGNNSFGQVAHSSGLCPRAVYFGTLSQAIGPTANYTARGQRHGAPIAEE